MQLFLSHCLICESIGDHGRNTFWCLKPGQLGDKASWVETGGEVTRAMAIARGARPRGWDLGCHERGG